MPWLQYGDADEPHFYYLGAERPSDDILEDLLRTFYESDGALQATYELCQRMPWIVIDKPSDAVLVRLIQAQTRTVKNAQAYLQFLQNELGSMDDLKKRLQVVVEAQGFTLYACSPRTAPDGTIKFVVNTGRSTQIDGWQTIERLNQFIKDNEKLVLDKATY